MPEFYHQLQQNPNPAQALRQAMLAVPEFYPHPEDWAAFTVIGASQ
jgi:CHAT domain-containing protein